MPPKRPDEATVLGLSNARFFVDTGSRFRLSKSRRLFAKLDIWASAAAESCPPPISFIVRRWRQWSVRRGSAGRLDGAWRPPQFKLVTGVSTGALIAPFAFLGPEYDAALTDVYTNIDQSKVLEKRFITAALIDDAMADTSPLYATISKYVDEHMMARIAAEYEKGRLLVIQTTDLDAGRPVLWNIGAIAKSGHPGALEPDSSYSARVRVDPRRLPAGHVRCRSETASRIRKCMSTAAR